MKFIGANYPYIYSVPNEEFNFILGYDPSTKLISYRSNTEFISDLGLATSAQLGDYVNTLYDQDVGGLKTFTGVYSAWQLNGDPYYARGFIQSLPSRVAIGTTNDSDVVFYRNVQEKVRITDSFTEFYHNVKALNISAQNASDKLIYDNVENFGSPLRINANASLGIYLQADGNDIFYVGPGFIESKRNFYITNGSVIYTSDSNSTEWAYSYKYGLANRGTWNNALIAKTDFPNAITEYAGDPSTTGFKSMYGTSLHIKGNNSWYNRLDFNTNGNIDWWHGINTTDMTYRGQLPIIPSGVTNWNSENLPDFRNYGLGKFTEGYNINIDQQRETGFYSQYAGITTGLYPFNYATILHQAYMNSNEFTQIAIQKGGVGMAFRNESTGWNYIWHSGNFNPDMVVKIGGAGTTNNPIYFRWTGSDLQLTVDNVTIGNVWTTYNFNPDSKANTNHTHNLLYSENHGEIDVHTLLEDKKFKFVHQIGFAAPNMFPSSNNANTIIAISKHPDKYGSLLGFNSDGDTFIKNVSYGNYGGWQQFAYRDWVNSQLQNYYTKNEALNLFVGKNGVETIYDTKTFNASPVIPNGTLGTHAVNLNQLNSKVDSWEFATSIGFSNGDINQAPYIVYDNATPIFLATQSWVHQNYITSIYLDGQLQNYAHKDAINIFSKRNTFQDNIIVPTAVDSNHAVNLGQVSAMTINSIEKNFLSLVHESSSTFMFDADVYKYPKQTTIVCRSTNIGNIRLENIQTGMTIKILNVSNVNLGITINGSSSTSVTVSSWIEIHCYDNGLFVANNVNGAFPL